jgi:hypothetical protein
MVLTVSFALSSGTGLSCPRRWPQCEKHCRQLDISVGISGPHDFAVRALRCSSSQRIRVHRIPGPTFVTIAKRPSVQGHGTAGLMDLIWLKREGKYFCSDDWTGSISLMGFKKFAVWRKGNRR